MGLAKPKAKKKQEMHYKVFWLRIDAKVFRYLTSKNSQKIAKFGWWLNLKPIMKIPPLPSHFSEEEGEGLSVA